MDPISAIGGATLALLVFGNDNETPVITSERPEGCVVQIAGSNAFSKTRFGVENPDVCGFVEYGNSETVKIEGPFVLPETETVQHVD